MIVDIFPAYLRYVPAYAFEFRAILTVIILIYKICHVELQYFTAAPQPCSMQPRSCYYLTMRENSTMPSTCNNARYNKMELIHTICLSQLVSQSFVMLDGNVKCSHIFMTSYIRVCLVVFQL